jgi:isopentenyl-diphosphate delta-isomerase type 1
MNTFNETLDVVDASDRVIRQALRRDLHRQGLRHRAVHIFIFDEDGRLYIQKRAAAKETHPSRYDSSASGHVDSGESYDVAAVRELREELGLDASLQKHFKIAACEATGWEFVWVYSARGDYHPVINPEEIESGKYWTVEEIEMDLKGHPERWSPAFDRGFREFQQYR